MHPFAWIFLLFALTDCAQGLESEPVEAWTGRWLPERATVPSRIAKPAKPRGSQPGLRDHNHGIKMGVLSAECDDAKTNLTLDWDNSPINYTCYTARFVPSTTTKALIEYENIPRYYSAMHSCMNESISYNEAIPTFGTHRALWPRYGEYRFLPAQRWLHSLEHGAIAMLYHPCADPALVDSLRRLLRGCLRRHIITPSTRLAKNRPLALVAWGVRLSMSAVDPDLVRGFVRQHALRGPERAPRDGQFDRQLLFPARNVSDFLDTSLCPLPPPYRSLQARLHSSKHN